MLIACVRRSGSEAMLESLRLASVPVLVFSAGMGDIIVHLLKKFKVNSQNIKIVSNFFKFDNEVIFMTFFFVQFAKKNIWGQS